ncbi:MAG: type II secretion system F family protein [Spirochaetales bacterium]|nr:type II secretion system F family protein [Spirochaetales bacterium]
MRVKKKTLPIHPFSRTGFLRWRLRGQELIDFMEELALLVDCGYSAGEALRCLGQDSHETKSGQISRQLLDSITEGMTFQGALEHHEKKFPPGFARLAGMGEGINGIASIFHHLADQERMIHSLKGELGAALFYPFFVLLSGFLALIYLRQGIFSQFLELTNSLNESTDVLSRSSTRLTMFSSVSGAMVILLSIFLYRKQRKHPFQTQSLMHWSFALGLLAQHGISLGTALQVASSLGQSEKERKQLRHLALLVQQGLTFSDALSVVEGYPSQVKRAVSIAESTGAVSHVFSSLSQHFYKQIHRRNRWISRMIEPLLILIVGIILLIGVGVYVLPFFESLGKIL